mmetsp:Transcript_8396/g.15179  ORF Transcript_8396/g.15179 Transcript_8396/m.15179 type:complete len:86 (+) Transcript_8396:1125-1382(+)
MLVAPASRQRRSASSTRIRPKPQPRWVPATANIPSSPVSKMDNKQKQLNNFSNQSSAAFDQTSNDIKASSTSYLSKGIRTTTSKC